MEQQLRSRVEAFVAGLPAGLSEVEVLGCRYDAGLAWVHHPEGLGGCGAPATAQAEVEALLVELGVPAPDPFRNPLGTGTIIPTLLEHASPELCRRMFRPAWTGEEIWCQLFSEPGAGSDLAGLATRAVLEDGDWRVSGQKVWTSFAHRARWGLLLTRTHPDLPKNEGITVFVIDMEQPGVTTRPLRQATGSSEFNEVYLDDAMVPDSHRVGDVCDGWRVTRTTLLHERTAIGGRSDGREAGRVAILAELWRARPDLHTVGRGEQVLTAWIDYEVARIANERTRQLARSGQPGLEGSGAKVVFADVNQQATKTLALLDPASALTYDDWDDEPTGERSAAYHYLRARANSIEGGTNEILLSQIADRVLGLPREPALPRSTPWKEIPR